MKKLMKLCLHVGLVVLATGMAFSSWSAIGAHAATGNNQAKRINAKAAVTMDAKTGKILYQQNAKKLYPVASCVKILTLAVIEQDIAHGKLHWNQKIKISKAVAKTSTDWHFSNVELKEGHKYTVRDLVNSMMIVSADGSAEALAFASAGSTKAFNKKMQAVARKAGVHDAKIYNMIGISNGEMRSERLKGVSKSAESQFSATDMAKIARYTVNHYPETLNITKQKTVEFSIDEHQSYLMHNLNGMLPGSGSAPREGEMDGLKTGTTDKAGNCFVGTGVFNKRRLITVGLNVPGNFTEQFRQTNNMLGIVLGKDMQTPAPKKQGQ